MKIVNAIRSWDRRVVKNLACHRNARLTRWMIFVTRLGDGWAWVFAGLLIALLDFQNGRITLERMGVGLGLQIVLYRVVKVILGRQRPYQLVDGVSCLILPRDHFSFPSGHAACAFLVLSVVAAGYAFLFFPLLVLSALISISRIYLGVHYPSDVIAGIILGITCGVFTAHLI